MTSGYFKIDEICCDLGSSSATLLLPSDFTRLDSLLPQLCNDTSWRWPALLVTGHEPWL